MTVGGITGENFLEKLQRQKRNSQNETPEEMTFSNNLQENDHFSKNPSADDTKITEDSSKDHIIASNSSLYSNVLQTSMVLHESGRVQFQAVVECAAKHISYAESDNVKVCIEEGFTFKAQIDADRHKVYIEKKSDNGKTIGYEVNPLLLNPDTTDPLEQMALESWEIAMRGFMGDAPFHKIDPKEAVFSEKEQTIKEQTVKEQTDYEDMTMEAAMQRFYEYIENRIKNGNEAYQLGGEAMSVKEWNRLIERIDADIDNAKEQIREEKQKADEESITTEQVARLLEDRDEDLKADEPVTTEPEEEIEIERETDTETSIKTRRNIFDKKQSELNAPYMELADENGIIEYHGVVFQCDTDSNSICLGDCSAGADYLTINLPDSGGVLKVNRDNISQLMDAITMFSPRDRWAILKAISTDSYTERIKQQIEEEESAAAE